jgi:hypothetical protein
MTDPLNIAEDALKKALKFYADLDNWLDPPVIEDGMCVRYGAITSHDCGKQARDALAALAAEKAREEGRERDGLKLDLADRKKTP